MQGRPGKKRRKSKDEPQKWGKFSRKGVKMTCSICKKTGHNKAVCVSRLIFAENGFCARPNNSFGIFEFGIAT